MIKIHERHGTCLGAAQMLMKIYLFSKSRSMKLKKIIKEIKIKMKIYSVPPISINVKSNENRIK